MTIEVHVERWAIDRLQNYERNPRKNKHAVSRMIASIEEFGFAVPVLVRSSTGEVIDGHLRLMAARKMKMTEVPVIPCDHWTDAQVKAFRLMVNRSTQWAEWDESLLSQELSDLQKFDFDLNLTGFDPRELTRLLAAHSSLLGLTDPDEIPALAESPVSVIGDLWVCGAHKVLVDDATKPENVTRLMAGEQADLIFIDPPYNVDYTGCTKKQLKIKGDNLSAADFIIFLEAMFQSCRLALKPNGSLYVCHASSWQREFQNALENAGFEMRNQIIWAKSNAAWGWGRYKHQHEPLFFCHVRGETDNWYGNKSQTSLWYESKPAANRDHPTAKPTELVERAVENSSKTGDLVCDLFGGSGSTLIACQRLGRSARLMELDPKYGDCIVRRFQEFTGTKAVLESDGRSFDELAEERLKGVL
jgi:DNA modification methylase